MCAAPHRLLIVEDEAPLRDGLRSLFEQSDFEVCTEADGVAALATLGHRSFDLVLLDVMLPGLDGFDVLARARARGDATPVLLLTARGSEDDIVRGLELGADDYVVKPFSARELVARGKGLLRRPRAREGVALPHVAGDLTFDFEGLEVWRAEAKVSLTAREADLLRYLVARSPNPVSRETLLVDVWGYRDGSVRTRTVDVHVQQLRAKLKVLSADSWISTVRGRGYRFEPT